VRGLVGQGGLFKINEAFVSIAIQSMRDLDIGSVVVNVNGCAIAIGPTSIQDPHVPTREVCITCACCVNTTTSSCTAKDGTSHSMPAADLNPSRQKPWIPPEHHSSTHSGNNTRLHLLKHPAPGRRSEV
jgi:hypothetical protein